MKSASLLKEKEGVFFLVDGVEEVLVEVDLERRELDVVLGMPQGVLNVIVLKTLPRIVHTAALQINDVILSEYKASDCRLPSQDCGGC